MGVIGAYAFELVELLGKKGFVLFLEVSVISLRRNRFMA